MYTVTEFGRLRWLNKTKETLKTCKELASSLNEAIDKLTFSAEEALAIKAIALEYTVENGREKIRTKIGLEEVKLLINEYLGENPRTFYLHVKQNAKFMVDLTEFEKRGIVLGSSGVTLGYGREHASALNKLAKAQHFIGILGDVEEKLELADDDFQCMLTYDEVHMLKGQCKLLNELTDYSQDKQE